jgi:hypothetical protein
MNTTLPPSRDLPPRRHAEIRDAVLSAAAPHPARRWLAPLVTAATALAAIGLVAWFVPWSGTAPAGGQPVSTPAEPTDTTVPAALAVPGVDPGEVPAIEKGCRESAIPEAKVTLRQVITDQAGRLALLVAVDATAGTESMVVCELDAPPTGYNAGFGGMSPYTGVVSLDFAMASAGGDVGGGKPEYAGRPGSVEIAGRVSPEVAKVTVSQSGDTVDAVIADGTYLARIVHPSDWPIPENHPAPVVHAYDKNGTLLGEIGP